MAVGMAAFQSANDINAVSGGIARDLNDVMARVAAFKEFLDGADLQDPEGPYKMTAEDEAQIKSAYADADNLRQVYEGDDTRTPRPDNYDYRQFLKNLYGFGTAT